MCVCAHVGSTYQLQEDILTEWPVETQYNFNIVHLICMLQNHTMYVYSNQKIVQHKVLKIMD